MPELEMPEGVYYSLCGLIRPNTGGQTRAFLMRNRLFAQHTSIRPTALATDAVPYYPEIRKALRESGQLVEGTRLLNLFEDLRSADLSTEPVVDCEVAELDRGRSVTEQHPDGSIYRTRYYPPLSDSLLVTDYHRPDGSRYLRIPAHESIKLMPGAFQVYNENEEPIQAVNSTGAITRFWVDLLTPPNKKAFIITDSRFILKHVMPLKSPRFHIIHLMHNTHTPPGRPWNHRIQPTYQHLFTGIRQLDGLVSLTKGQREDARKVLGPVNNLFAVPNPVDLPTRPETPEPRAEHRFVSAARLHPQKRLDDAVKIFARVLKRVPDATYDIYGDGPVKGSLQRQIDDLGIGHAVTLRGYDARARDQLWTATGFLMTSRYEGYPLATLESLSHGCPVISYDIKYGPNEQITDGVDGYIVAPGDLDGFADRIVQMAENPGQVARMSEAAFKKAEKHDYQAFLADWHHVLTTVAKQKNQRVDIKGVRLSDEKVERETGLGKTRRRRPASASTGRGEKLFVSGQLDIDIARDAGRLKASQVELNAICDKSTAICPVPVTFTRKGSVIRFEATVDPQALFAELGEDSVDVWLRLTYVCANFSWTGTLGRQEHTPNVYEVAFDRSSRLLLTHAGDDQAGR